MKKIILVIAPVLFVFVLIGIFAVNRYFKKTEVEYKDFQKTVSNAKLIKVSSDKYEFYLPDYFKQNKEKQTGELLSVYESTLTKKDVQDMVVVSLYPENRTVFTSMDCQKLASNQANSLTSKLTFNVVASELRKGGQACYYKLLGKLYDNQNPDLGFRRESYAVLYPGGGNVLVISMSYGPTDAEVMTKSFESLTQSVVLK